MSVRDYQLEMLKAVVNRIIPVDDYPGGWDAGVVDYIFRQFKGDLSERFLEFAKNLDRLDVASVAKHFVPFVKLDPTDQDALLLSFDTPETPHIFPRPASGFVNWLVNLSQEGFYADPGNGGNRDEISWKMIGYEHRPLGRNSIP